MRKQLIDPPQLHDGSPFGMSQAAIDTASATVYISGQIDWDVNNQVSCHTVEGQLLADKALVTGEAKGIGEASNNYRRA